MSVTVVTNPDYKKVIITALERLSDPDCAEGLTRLQLYALADNHVAVGVCLKDGNRIETHLIDGSMVEADYMNLENMMLRDVYSHQAAAYFFIYPDEDGDPRQHVYCRYYIGL